MKYISIIIILTLSILPTLLASIEDYFEQITTFSDGRLTRFDPMPLRVYVGEIPVPSALEKQYLAVLDDVFSIWEEVSEGKLIFAQTVDQENADIRLSWNQRLPSYPNQIGEAILVRTETFHVEIKIGLRDPTTISLLRPSAAKSVLLHEFGHAIGLWGHSQDRRDVMHFAATASYPTKRDINTLLKIYSTPVDTPFHKQAIAVLRLEIELQPQNPRYHYLLGSVYADEGRYQSAIESLNRALELEPNFTGITERLAMAFEKSGMYDKAIRHYSKLLRSNPTMAIYGAIGTLNLLQGKYRKAIDFYRNGLICFEKNCDENLDSDAGSSVIKHNILAVYHLWATKLIQAEQYTNAIDVLQQATQEYPSSIKLIFNQAVALEGAGEYVQAIEHYKRVLDLDQNHIRAKIGIASALNNLGATKLEAHNWESAIKFCNEAIEYDSSCWQARRNIEDARLQKGWEMIEADRLDDAIEEYQTLLKIAPNNVRAHNNLGVAFFKKKEYDKAIAEFNKALSLDPQFEDSIINLDRAQKKKSVEVLKQVLIPVLVIIALSFILVKLTKWQGDKSRGKT